MYRESRDPVPVRARAKGWKGCLLCCCRCCCCFLHYLVRHASVARHHHSVSHVFHVSLELTSVLCRSAHVNDDCLGLDERPSRPPQARTKTTTITTRTTTTRGWALARSLLSTIESAHYLVRSVSQSVSQSIPCYTVHR